MRRKTSTMKRCFFKLRMETMVIIILMIEMLKIVMAIMIILRRQK